MTMTPRTGPDASPKARAGERAGIRSAPTRRRSRFVVLVVVSIVLVLVVLMLSQWLDQIIFPGQTSQGDIATRVDPPPSAELVRLRTSSGIPIGALFGVALDDDGSPRLDATDRPTLLFFYGNAMSIAASLDLFEAFRRLGLNVLIPDYAGYGISGGRASEASCYATADACLDFLLDNRRTGSDRIIVSGWSLGGAVAIDLAARRRVAGLAVFSTVTSVSDVARTHLPLLPAAGRLLARYRFASLEKMPRVQCPILIGHGDRDPLIPVTMMTRLAAAARAPVQQLVIEGAGHNDFWLVGNRRLMTSLKAFAEYSGGSSPSASP